MVAIVLGLILLLLFDGIIRGSDQAIFGNAVRVYGGNLQVHAPGYRDKAARLPMLPLDDPEAVVQAARALPDVQAVAAAHQHGGHHHQSRQFGAGGDYGHPARCRSADQPAGRERFARALPTSPMTAMRSSSARRWPIGWE